MTSKSVGEAFSAGVGLALGLAMAQYMSQVLRTSERAVKQVIVCLKCGSKNPVENKFCGQCGQAFYAGHSVKCPKCGSTIPCYMNFCGSCGLPLRKVKKKRGLS